MYARSVSMRLKPEGLAEFSRLVEEEVIPLLQRQRGFQDQIILLASGGKEAIEISFWDSSEDAETYNRETFPEVLKVVEKVSVGSPHVRTYQSCSSTYRRVAASVMVPLESEAPLWRI